MTNHGIPTTTSRRERAAVVAGGVTSAFGTTGSPFRHRATSVRRMPADEFHRLSTVSSRVTALGHYDPSAIEWTAHPASRRPSIAVARRQASSGPNAPSRIGSSQFDLGDRTSSKLTLDEELYDILFAFGEELAEGEENEEDEVDPNRPMTRQSLLSKIRQQKEVINKLRSQPWSMQRKRRTLRLAQKYLEQYEYKVSRAHALGEEIRKRWHFFIRWLSNVRTYLIPWESKIKRIESHFGSVVSSYFVLLRWVIFLNVSIMVIILAIVVFPEVIADLSGGDFRRQRTASRKHLPREERIHADEFQVVWHYGGYLRYSPLFYGYYSNDEIVTSRRHFGYSMPIAYFVAVISVFAYSFFAILRKMASNASMSKLAGSKAEQYIFNWKVFTGWDYTIGNSETASNTVMAVIIKLRESIAETRVQNREKFQCVRFSLRVLANMVIIAMLAFSIYCITFAVQSSQTVESSGNLLTKNQVPTIVSTITHVFPMIFDLIGRMENYHPRTAHRAHLARVLVLYVLNYCTLIFALFEKLDKIRDSKSFVDENSNSSFQSRNFTDPSQLQRILLPDRMRSQFGPVAVNYPSASIRRETQTNRRRYDVRRTGPTKLPRFPPASTTPQPSIRLFRNDRFGPHWNLDESSRRSEAVAEELRSGEEICWETMIGQELIKLPEYGEFKVAENIMHLINNQGMIWLGLFFAPMLPAINSIKLMVFMYLRCWAAMSCNVPAREIFRASRSSNFYLMILLLWLLLCTLPVGYVIASKRPSSNCGPFAGQDQFYRAITQLLEARIDKNVLRALRYIASPGVVIPVLLFLLLIIYFLVSLVRGLREANADLQRQLVHERTEEKKKIFELAGGGAQKKRSELGTRSQPKKMGHYLPDIERKRREPWRAHHEVENPLSFCPSDEPPTSTNSPSIGLSPVSTRKRSDRGLLTKSPVAECRRRFSALNMASDIVNTEPISTVPIPVDLGDDRSERSAQSSMGPRAPTPSELRNLMAPLVGLSLNTQSALSLSGFPKDSAAVTVIFGTQSGMSRRSSNRDSHLSLYDNNRSLAEEPPSRYSKIIRTTDTIGFPLTQTNICGASTSEAETRINPSSRPLRTSHSRPPPIPSTSKALIKPPTQSAEIKDPNSEFVPWPTIEEVRAQRAHLLNRSQKSWKPTQQPAESSSSADSKTEKPKTLPISQTRQKPQTLTEDRAASQPPPIAKAASFVPLAPRVEFGEDDSPRVEEK